MGEAVRLAHAMGGAGSLDRLAQVVEIVDAAAGRVRMRAGVAAIDFERLITASSHSTYGPVSAPGRAPTSPAGPAGAVVPCPACGKKASVTARFCPSCGQRLGERP
ncbi:zinc ribbon domain-containing protein [Streptomyces geranii]|uniref:zinc ribbon domain-containing protein n=1 Tax=Streptomyces geranii TaxID=2058923 RepID=UPI001E3606DE|nr:zinc ribbon domain-containing protein [Streptomyces geranii]